MNKAKVFILPLIWIAICIIWLIKDIMSFLQYFIITGLIGMFIDFMENKYFNKKDILKKENFINMSKEQAKSLLLSWLALPFWIVCKIDKKKRLPKWINIKL